MDIGGPLRGSRCVAAICRTMYGAPNGGHRAVVNLFNPHSARATRWSLPAIWRADFGGTGTRYFVTTTDMAPVQNFTITCHIMYTIKWKLTWIHTTFKSSPFTDITQCTVQYKAWATCRLLHTKQSKANETLERKCVDVFNPFTADPAEALHFAILV